MNTTMLRISAALVAVVGVLAALDVNRYATAVLAFSAAVLIVTSLPRRGES